MYSVSVKLEKSLNSIGLNAQIVNTFNDTDVILIKRGVERDLKLVVVMDNKVSLLPSDDVRNINKMLATLINEIFMEKFFVTTYDNMIIHADKLIRLSYNDAVVPIIKIRVIGSDEYEVVTGALFLPDERWLSTRVNNTNPIVSLHVRKRGGMYSYKLLLNFDEFMKAYEFKFSGLNAIMSGLKLTSGLYSLMQRRKVPIIEGLKYPVFKEMILNTKQFVMSVLDACKDSVEALDKLQYVGYGFITDFKNTYLFGYYGSSPDSVYTKSRILKGGLYSMIKRKPTEFYNTIIRLLCNY